MNYWILLTGVHLSATYIEPEGDTYSYDISPNRELGKGDMVYLWWNGHPSFYGRGIIAETPMDFVEGENDALHKGQRQRQRVVVNRIQGFTPRLTEQMMQGDSNLKTMIPTGFDDLYAIPLRSGQAYHLDDYVKKHGLDVVIQHVERPRVSNIARVLGQDNTPDITIQALLTFGDKTSEGQLIEAVSIPWFEIVKLISRDPEEIYKIDPRKFEELIAGAYEREGWDEVILTPSSGDKGRDVIATKHGVGSIRLIDQVKLYKVSRPVTADEVKSLIGVIAIDPSVSKGVITTTSTFAPRLFDDENIKRWVPFRLELKPRSVLIPWLEDLAKDK